MDWSVPKNFDVDQCVQFASDELEAGTTTMWFAGKELLAENKLRDHIGRHENSKVIVKLQQKGQGAPAREPVRPDLTWFSADPLACQAVLVSYAQQGLNTCQLRLRVWNHCGTNATVALQSRLCCLVHFVLLAHPLSQNPSLEGFSQGKGRKDWTYI